MTDAAASLADALRDRYTLERELGRGGMATVYLARDLKHDRLVALKVLHSGLAAMLGPQRFLQEIRFAARLQHPHILTVFDSGETSPGGGTGAGHLWFTMPYVEGESLCARLDREGRLPVPEALRIAREVGAALHHAHQHGVVHRDVKPENILLTKDGHTLVADFGVARMLGDDAPSGLTATGISVGTPKYMSPEQAAGVSAVDGRSDLYSLGCVLYEMLTGAPPFRAPTARAVMVQHIHDPAPPVSLPGGTSGAINAVLACALAKSPGDRFATAADFVQALGTTTTDPTASVVAMERPRGVPPARAAALALGAGGLLLLAMLAGRGLAERQIGGGGRAGRPLTLSQLTVAEGVEEWPAWSPDGARLAYVGEADGYKRVYVRTMATGEDRRLTRTDRDEIQPAWAPNGMSVAFVRADSAHRKLEPSDINGWFGESGDIWTHDIPSGAETRLVADAFGPAWSPDGTLLAFDARWAGPRRIWVADARGRNARQVTADSNDAVVHADPHWSPDGKRLVFRRIEKTQQDIATVDLASGRVVRLTNDIVADLDPAWAPDGRYIYFASARGGGLNLWRVPVRRTGDASGPAEQLTTGAGDDVQPAPSPDRRRLAFAVRGINSDLWRLPVSPENGRPTGAPEAVVATTRVESRGAWSPDGTMIAFNSDRTGDMSIWVRTLATGAERQLTRGRGGDYQPSWSPDGRTIVFFSARGGNADIWAVRVRDGALARLTKDPGTDTNPFYSPDGRLIAFLSDRNGRNEPWVMNANGSGQRRLYDGAAGGHFLRWTADGKAVVLRTEHGSQTEVLAVPVARGAGAPTRLPAIASGAHMSFSPDHSLILDVRGHKSLWVHPLDGRAPYEVFQFPDPDVRIDYPVWSPDGRWILFDRAAPRNGDLWMLAGLK